MGKTDGTSEDDEKAADTWSGDMLIAADDYEIFLEQKDYSEEKILGFARQQGIAPGIIVGRMQRERLLKYSELNNLKEKYDFGS